MTKKPTTRKATVAAAPDYVTYDDAKDMFKPLMRTIDKMLEDFGSAGITDTLHERLLELETLQMTGAAPAGTFERINAIRFLLGLPRGDKRPTQRRRPTLDDFRSNTKTWGQT